MTREALFANRALARQLKRYLALDGEPALEQLVVALQKAAPDHPLLGGLAERLPKFLHSVDDSYAAYDRDLVLRTRSLTISSDELSHANEQLRHETQRQQEVLDALRATTRELTRESRGAGQAESEHRDDDLLGMAQLIRELLAQRELAQAEVLATRTRLVSAIEALDVGFAMCDVDDRLVICNETFRRFYPSVSELLVPGTDLTDVLRAYHRRVIASRRNAPGEDEWIASRREARRHGGSREILVGDRWVREDDAYTPEGLLVLLRTDITPMKRLNLSMAQARDAAEAANRAKSEFLANMSHEIRTPMNGVIGMTALALDTQLDEEQREYLEMVRSSADSLLTIINDILDFSKMEADMMTIERVPLSLSALLDECLKPLGVRAFGQGLELLYRVAPDVPDALLGDPGRLRQVLTNLVGNSIKFTHAGQISVEVVLSEATQPDALVLEFSVCDTGIGIPAEQQKAIFDPFSQADSSITRRYGGTGLGLAIVRRLVDLMGGQLGLTSVPGGGSDFRFTVRMHPARNEPSAASGRRELAPLQGLSVLIVDDNPTHCEWLAESFRQWGMRPTTVTTAEQAAALLGDRQRRFAVCLLDSDMPGLNGFDVAQHFAQVPAILRHTWMMLTAPNLAPGAARCKQLGVAGYVTKPVLRSDLLDELLDKLGAGTKAIDRVTPAGIQQPPAVSASACLDVLLVEDMPVNLKLATHLLGRLGHRVSVAENGAVALARTAEQRFDVVLMDMQMPIMDGLRATRAIRAREAEVGGPRQCIVAMTANAMAGDRERCLESGMDGYLSKPIDRVRLVAEIDRVLGRQERDAVGVGESAVTEGAPDIEIDIDTALDRLGGDRASMLELAQMFIQDCPQRVTEIEAAVTARDPAAVSSACHNLSGTASNLSAVGLQELVGRINARVKAGDWSRADELLVLLPVRLQALENQLERWAKPLQAPA